MEQMLTTNQIMFSQAVNRVMEENPNATDSMEGLLQKVSEEVIKMQIDSFPSMCDYARIQNKIKFDNLRGIAKNGRFDTINNTETFWSNEGNFVFDYDIPQDLYAFMEHVVYKDFWHESNTKIWRPFMKAICSRHSAMTKYEAMNLLIKVKQIYGSNADASLTR